MKGTVKWFNLNKRFGYITGEDGNDIFVHTSGIDKGRTFVGLCEGDEVEFDITEGRKGSQAAKVTLVGRHN